MVETTFKPCKEYNPCVFGSCWLDKEDIAYCNCKKGFIGDFCNIKQNLTENFCTEITCQNNGKCISLLDRFECVCKDGFDGILCQDKLTKNDSIIDTLECSQILCQHNGTCRKNFLDGKINNYCDCLPGFTGQFCESIFNKCLSSNLYH